MIMLFWKKWTKSKPKALPMHPENILIITSDARLLDNILRVLYKNGYSDNSDMIRMDNGDFAQVVKEKS